MNESNFPRIMEYLKETKSIYLRAFSAFHVFETLEEALKINIVGEEKAKQNQEVMSNFKNFFLTSKESLRVYFFLELAKLLDVSDKSLQINKIINITENNISKLTVNDFENYNKDRQLLEELVKGYKGITHENINEIRKTLKKEKNVISKIHTYRNKWLAHNDIKKPKIPTISSSELRSLFSSIEKIINLFTNNINYELTMWDHIEKSSKLETQVVLANLYKFEKYRTQEIENDMKEEETIISRH